MSGEEHKHELCEDAAGNKSLRFLSVSSISV
jgi:hypothetical protein